MQLDEFIFSEKPLHRITRHLAFWSIYCTFFWLQSFAPRKYSELFESDTYYFAFLNVCAFGPVSVLLVYVFIYVLLPYLRQQRYFHFFFYFFLLYAGGTFINYYTAGIFLNTVTYSIPVEANFQHRMEFGNYNTRWGMIIAIIALGVKLTKDWYLQQQENLEILSKKTRTEMQLQKARIHPNLLFRSLDSIYANIQIGSKYSSKQILNLSDLLSYSLYESEIESVPLEKELMEVERLISLENFSNEYPINLRIQSEGDTGNCFIAPMAAVKLVEECINNRNMSNSFCRQIDINVIDKNLLNIIFSLCNLRGFLSTDSGTFFIENIHKMLEEQYNAQDYKIEVDEDAEEILIKIELKLLRSRKSNAIQRNMYDPA